MVETIRTWVDATSQLYACLLYMGPKWEPLHCRHRNLTCPISVVLPLRDVCSRSIALPHLYSIWNEKFHPNTVAQAASRRLKFKSNSFDLWSNENLLPSYVYRPLVVESSCLTSSGYLVMRWNCTENSSLNPIFCETGSETARFDYTTKKQPSKLKKTENDAAMMSHTPKYSANLSLFRLFKRSFK